MKITFFIIILFIITTSCDNRKLPVPRYNPVIKVTPRSAIAELNKSIDINLDVIQDTAFSFISSIKYSATFMSLRANKRTILWGSMEGQFFLNKAETPIKLTEPAILKYGSNVVQYIPQQKGEIALVFYVRAESPYIGFSQDTVFLDVR